MVESTESEETQSKITTTILPNEEIANQIQEWFKHANGILLDKEISRELETHLRKIYSDPVEGMDGIKESIKDMKDNDPFAYLADEIKKISLNKCIFSKIKEIIEKFSIRFRKKITVYLLFFMMFASYLALWAPMRIFFQKYKIQELLELPIDNTISKYYLFEILLYAALAPATFWLGYLLYTWNIAHEKGRKWRAIKKLFKVSRSVYVGLFILVFMIQVLFTVPNLSASLYSSNTLGLILPTSGSIIFGFWIDKAALTLLAASYAYFCFDIYNTLNDNIRRNIVNKRKLDRVKEAKKSSGSNIGGTNNILQYSLLAILSLITASLTYVSIKDVELTKIMKKGLVENSKYSQIKRELQEKFERENLGTVNCQKVINHEGQSLQVITSLVLKEIENPFEEAGIKIKELKNVKLKDGTEISCEDVNTLQKITNMISEKSKFETR